MAREAAKITDNLEDWTHFRRLRNECSKATKRRKNDFFSDIFQSYSETGDVKNTYRTVKNILGWTSSAQPKMFLVAGFFFRKPTELANILQKHYTAKVKKLVEELKKSGLDPLRYLDEEIKKWGEGGGVIPKFSLRKVTLAETLDFIGKLNNSTAHGLDGQDALSIKSAAVDLAGPLTHIINVSLQTTTFANKWKLSKIVPLLK